MTGAPDASWNASPPFPFPPERGGSRLQGGSLRLLPPFPRAYPSGSSIARSLSAPTLRQAYAVSEQKPMSMPSRCRATGILLAPFLAVGGVLPGGQVLPARHHGGADGGQGRPCEAGYGVFARIKIDTSLGGIPTFR